MTSRERARELSRVLRRGCGDASCAFERGPKAGMRTNGGCRCHERIEDAIREAEAAAVREALEEAARLCDALQAEEFKSTEGACTMAEECARVVRAMMPGEKP